MPASSFRPSPKPTTWHLTHPQLLSGDSPVQVLLIGCGGNGTAVLRSLVRLHRALTTMGHAGLQVTLCDGGDVREANLARQPFTAADVGQNKARVLANRVNISYDLRWEAAPVHFTLDAMPGARQCEFMISCVDTRRARGDIYAATAQMRRILYWLDLGNKEKSGQVLLGTLGVCDVPLPTARTKWPNICDASLDADDDAPSCSSAEALRRQDLFVHDVLASCASNLLWRLLRDGKLRHHGAFCNLETGATRPIAVPSPSTEKTGAD